MKDSKRCFAVPNLLTFYGARICWGAIVSSFIEVLVEKLSSSETIDYFQSKLDVNLLKKLNNSLHSIDAVTEDAELKQIGNIHVKLWISDVKNVVMDAEDLLDEIYIRNSKSNPESSESQINTTNTDKVTNLLDINVSSFEKTVESRLQEIIQNLELLLNRKDVLSLKDNVDCGVNGGSEKSLPSTHRPLACFMYGRDTDKEMVFDWLKSDDKILSIISLVGMGGIGKTTLAQHLYNDPIVQTNFDVTAWVYVDEFDVCKITRATLAAITGSDNGSTELNMVQDKLTEKLLSKKFLIVLDNVWNENRRQWRVLKIPFKNGAKGSKLIVTTRSEQVASVMDSSQIHLLQQLEEEHSWHLFAKHAFKNKEGSQITRKFEKFGKRVVKKCQGLPLALEAIGNLLSTQSTLREWQRISESDIWDLPGETEIIPALMLSYNKLPSHLKRCFEYCATFPKGFLFDKDHLILLWMAENFIQCPLKPNQSMKQVGELYFNDLLLRSFFQPSRKYENYFIMHDLLHDLAESVFGDFCFTLEDKKGKNISRMTRHFSFLCDEVGSSKGLETLYNANKLRTFLPLSMISYQHQWLLRLTSNTLELPMLFTKCKLLRVLSLCGYLDMVELPDTISNLKHLRHLDLSRTLIRKLPDSLCSLFYLQTLKIRDCEYLEELPANLHKLVNLYYLDFSGTKVTTMPMQMGKLKKLEVLSSFYVDKGSESNVQHLGDLNLHGNLSIFELQNITNPFDAALADLESKPDLVKLKLRWNETNDSSQKEREVLEKLKPSEFLMALSIKKYGGTLLPSWLGDDSLSSVVSLKLSNCENCVLLPSLGVMSSLKHLQIIGLSGIVMIGEKFYRDRSSSSLPIPFPSLETLSFKDMSGWEEWDSVVEGAFPRLQKLSIVRCPKLKDKMPKVLECLLTLKIRDCKQLVASVPYSPIISKLRLTDCGKLELTYQLSTLKFLEIHGCCMEGSSVDWIGLSECGTNIKLLKIENCPTMDIPISACYNFLVKLDITGSCDSLTTFPLDMFPNLDSLHVFKCSNFEMIAQENEHRKLTFLSIGENPNFASFPKEGLSAPRLQDFDISKLENLKSLPKCMHTLLQSLHKLSIDDCPQLESFSDRSLPSSLRNLFLVKCSKLLVNSMKRALPTNSSLCNIYIQDVDVESFPDQGLLPSSLTCLTIKGCQNLQKLDYKGLNHLPSLTTLSLINCPNIRCLPKEGLPKSISSLQIWGNCSLLKQRCKKSTGKDWSKISHIDCVMIDNNMSSNF